MATKPMQPVTPVPVPSDCLEPRSPGMPMPGQPVDMGCGKKPKN
jgi:hypothetical protein